MVYNLKFWALENLRVWSVRTYGYTHTYLGSISLSQPSIEMMLGCHPGSSLHTSSNLASLAIAAARPNWQCLDDVEVPLHQRSLMMLHIITSSPQLPLLPSKHWLCPLGYLTPETGWKGSPLPPWAFNSKTEGFAAICSIGLGSHFTFNSIPSQNVVVPLMFMEIIRFAVVAMVTTFPDTKPSGMWFSVQP